MEKKTKTDWKETSWLMSDSFWKRAFAIYGYSLVAGLVLLAGFYLLIFLASFIMAVSTW